MKFYLCLISIDSRALTTAVIMSMTGLLSALGADSSAWVSASCSYSNCLPDHPTGCSMDVYRQTGLLWSGLFGTKHLTVSSGYITQLWKTNFHYASMVSLTEDRGIRVTAGVMSATRGLQLPLKMRVLLFPSPCVSRPSRVLSLGSVGRFHCHLESGDDKWSGDTDGQRWLQQALSYLKL